jgi:streptogramin lyase
MCIFVLGITLLALVQPKAAEAGIDLFPVPTANSGPVGIAAGPDGALWFTEQNVNQIGRITTAGSVSEFLVPTANSEPFRIAPGPDGAMWFTEISANKIGRITTTGSITEFPIPTSEAGPIDITAGPDGALWFTEPNSNQIGRIAAVPTSKPQCRNGGWRNFPGFKNQGDCVSFFGKNPPAS